jgi:hypothetical protein
MPVRVTTLRQSHPAEGLDVATFWAPYRVCQKTKSESDRALKSFEIFFRGQKKWVAFWWSLRTHRYGFLAPRFWAPNLSCPIWYPFLVREQEVTRIVWFGETSKPMFTNFEICPQLNEAMYWWYFWEIAQRRVTKIPRRLTEDLSISIMQHLFQAWAKVKQSLRIREKISITQKAFGLIHSKHIDKLFQTTHGGRLTTSKPISLNRELSKGKHFESISLTSESIISNFSSADQIFLNQTIFIFSGGRAYSSHEIYSQLPSAEANTEIVLIAKRITGMRCRFGSIIPV